jgi:phosphoglycolate phosphatase-like HAD superfamily hydrolase
MVTKRIKENNKSVSAAGNLTKRGQVAPKAFRVNQVAPNDGPDDATFLLWMEDAASSYGSSYNSDGHMELNATPDDLRRLIDMASENSIPKEAFAKESEDSEPKPKTSDELYVEMLAGLTVGSMASVVGTEYNREIKAHELLYTEIKVSDVGTRWITLDASQGALRFDRMTGASHESNKGYTYLGTPEIAAAEETEKTERDEKAKRVAKVLTHLEYRRHFLSNEEIDALEELLEELRERGNVGMETSRSN